GEVLVFPSPEAVARHDDMAPEPPIVLVETGDTRAFVDGQERLQHCPAVAVEMRRGAHPVDGLDTRVDVDRAVRTCCERRVHFGCRRPSGVDQAPFRLTGYLRPQKESGAKNMRALLIASSACEV